MKIKNKSKNQLKRVRLLTLLWASTMGLFILSISSDASPKNKGAFRGLSSFAPSLYSFAGSVGSHSGLNRFLAQAPSSDKKTFKTIQSNDNSLKRFSLFSPSLKRIQSSQDNSFKNYHAPDENLSKDYLSHPYYVSPNIELYKFNFPK